MSLRFKFSRQRSDLGGGDDRSLYSLLRVTGHLGNHVVTFAVFNPWSLGTLDVRRVFRREANLRITRCKLPHSPAR